MKIANAFAYIIYGESREHFEEAVLSIGTLRKFSGDRHILVLTDRPDWFPPVPAIRTIPIDARMREQWMGSSGYHFRMKLQGLRHLLRFYAKKVIFLDTDTLVRRNINSWFPRIDSSNAVLHRFEGVLSNKQFRSHYRDVLDTTLISDEYGRFNIHAGTLMYNSGVIGVSEQHLPCLDAALWLMDQVDARITAHTAEQMALSYVLASHGNVRTVGDRNVYHYWYRDRGRHVQTQLTELLQRYPVRSVLCDPRIATQVRMRRGIELWKRDKLHRLRRKGIVTPVAKWIMRRNFNL